MSYTQNIINEIKSLTEKAKSNNKKDSQSVYAQSNFIDKLLQMEQDYNQKTKAQMPDYDKIIPMPTPPKKWDIKDEKTLKKEAGDYYSNLVKQNHHEINQDAYIKEQNIKNQQQKASEQLKYGLEKSQSSFEKNRENILAKTTRQGLTHSTIREHMLDNNLNLYLDAIEVLRQEHTNYTEDLKRQIDLINSAKEQAILEYNIKSAAEYEKKLNALKEEQLKAMESMIEYNKNLQNANQVRLEQIKELENNWLKEQQRKEQEQLQKELAEGYSGEKALEMEDRYQIAKNFYMDMDKKKAIDLIQKDKEVLKSVLGLYYNRLIKEIEN